MNRLKQHMDEALSDLRIDSHLTQKVTSNPCKSRHYRARPLIAACVMLLCVITVAAAVSSGFSMTHEDNTLLAEFEPMAVTLSPEVEEKLEQLIIEHGEDYGEIYFSTLSEAENYLGITFLHSDLIRLENAPAVDGNGNPKPYGINMMVGRGTSAGEGYWVNLTPDFTYQTFNDSDGMEEVFSVFMTIQLYTVETDYTGGMNFLNVEAGELSEYTTTSGITASVASIFDIEGGAGQASAHFIVDGIGYSIQMYGTDSVSSRQALYDLLESLH